MMGMQTYGFLDQEEINKLRHYGYYRTFELIRERNDFRLTT